VDTNRYSLNARL